MASYISKYTGKQIDGVVELFEGKGLSDVTGIIQRDVDGNFSTKTISWSDVDSTKPTTLSGYGITDAKIANGAITLGSNTIIVATLENGKVPESQLPSYVDDVLEFANRSAFPVSGEAGKIYVALDTNLTYRWSGSEYVEISQSLALGETSSTAYQGDRGKIAYDHAVAKGSQFTSGLYKFATNSEGHVITATAVQNGVDIKTINGQDILGSGNITISDSVEDVTVDGTSVVTNKIAQINLSGKQDKLIDTQTADQNIKTINGISILGSGNIEIGGGGVSVQSNWTETDTSSAAYILNKPTLSTVATTGSYNDLTDKPTIPPQLTAGTGITIDSNNVISVNLVNAETQSF